MGIGKLIRYSAGITIVVSVARQYYAITRPLRRYAFEQLEPHALVKRALSDVLLGAIVKLSELLLLLTRPTLTLALLRVLWTHRQSRGIVYNSVTRTKLDVYHPRHSRDVVGRHAYNRAPLSAAAAETSSGSASPSSQSSAVIVPTTIDGSQADRNSDDSAKPVIVFFHGGAWAWGSR
jgi:hypothetical protein